MLGKLFLITSIDHVSVIDHRRRHCQLLPSLRRSGCHKPSTSYLSIHYCCLVH